MNKSYNNSINSKTKRILVISWFFPPINSSEGLVTYKLLKNSSLNYDVFCQNSNSSWSYGEDKEFPNCSNINTIYSNANNLNDWKTEAIDFFNTIKGYKYTLIPCLDIESNSLGRNATQISDRCIEFLNKFKELSGQDCIIYTGAYFGRDNLDSRVKKYKGWIAHYGVSTPMATGFTVVGHQYSETGKVKGVGGNCDINNFDNAILLNKSRQNFKITATANIESYGIKNYSGINHILIGTTGQGKRLEAISINIDGIDFSYLVHVQGLGDVGGSIKGQVLGTIGEKIRLEGIAFNVKSIPKGYKLLYRTHIEKQGWGKWCNAGQYSGTKGKGLRMEAVEIKIE